MSFSHHNKLTLKPSETFPQKAAVELTDLEEEEKIWRLRAIVKNLPQHKWPTIKWLSKLLRDIASHTESNLMTCESLATCLGPDLIQPKIKTLEQAREIPIANLGMSLLFANFEEIFSTLPNDGWSPFVGTI